MSRRGRDSGSTLTASTCEVGAKVRVTASTGLMAGQIGTIVKGEGSEHPTIRFKSGQELSFPSRKLQLMSGPPTDKAEYATGKRVQVHEAEAKWVDPHTGEEKTAKITDDDPIDKPKRPAIKRNDADWNF